MDIITELDLHIGKIQTSSGDNYFSLEVTDRLSRVRFLEVKLDYRQFATLVGTSEFVCEVPTIIKGVDKLGKSLEHKIETIVVDSDERRNIEYVRLAVLDYEMDGWVADSYDLTRWNHHRLNPAAGTYSVGFTRYVD